MDAIGIIGIVAAFILLSMHSVEILREYSYTHEQIDAYIASGAVATKIHKK